MGFENSKSEGGERVFILLKEQYDRLGNINPNNSEDVAFTQSLGIEFDSGDIVIEVDGEKKMMTTQTTDFGTELTGEMIEDLYGAEKRKEIEG